SGPTSANTLTPSPAAKSAIRSHPARSGRPRRRRRTTAWRNRSAATAAARSGITVEVCPLEAEVAGDDHALHLVRALADLEDLLVAVEPRDRELVHEAVAAVDLERCVHGAVREQAGVELRLRRRQRERLSRVLEPGGAVDELPARVDLGRHVGQLELDRLEARDRPPELVPLLGVRGGEV